jgi:hypothetical protein
MEALLGTRTLKVMGVLAVLSAPLMFKFGMDYYEARVVKALEAKFAPILQKQEEFNELTRAHFLRDEGAYVKMESMEKRIDKLEAKIDAANGYHRGSKIDGDMR